MCFVIILYRTPEEFSKGHACGAINVPYMNRGASGIIFAESSSVNLSAVNDDL